MSSRLAHFALLATTLCATGAGAEDPDPARLSFSGFGTLGVVHSSESDADFTSTDFKPNGAGHSHVWSADVDSLIAVQATANFTRKFSAVLQVVSEQNHDKTYWPHVEWANLKYQFTPDLSLRVGRTVLPTFLVTDSRKVGYANPWVRPPVEVYNLVPVTRNDGVDASYRLRIGSTTNTFQVAAGRSDSDFPGGGTFAAGTAQARGAAALAITFEQGSLTVRLNYGRTRLTIPEFAPLFEGFRQFGPEGVAIADTYDVNQCLVTFLGIGASYDPGKWFIMGEWGRVNTRSVLGENTGWFASGGYRFRRLTTYATYAQLRADHRTSDPGLNVSSLPPFLAGPAAGLNDALNSILSAKRVQNTVSVGGRWDLTNNAALKLQLDHARHGAGSAGTLLNLQPGFRPGGNVTLVSATVDVVF